MQVRPAPTVLPPSPRSFVSPPLCPARDLPSDPTQDTGPDSARCGAPRSSQSRRWRGSISETNPWAWYGLTGVIGRIYYFRYWFLLFFGMRRAGTGIPGVGSCARGWDQMAKHYDLDVEVLDSEDEGG